MYTLAALLFSTPLTAAIFWMGSRMSPQYSWGERAPSAVLFVFILTMAFRELLIRMDAKHNQNKTKKGDPP